MSANFSRLLSSEVLQLVSGSEETQFLVHAGLLASQSECLRNLVEETPEVPSVQRRIHMAKWDTATVGRLVEFVYTKDYHCPDPVPLDTPVVTPEGGSVSGEEKKKESEPEFQLPRLQKLLTSGQLVPLSKMFAPQCLDPERRLSAAETFANKSFNPPEHDFEEVLLAHAKIYVIALAFEVQALCTLALQRLMRTLVGIDPVPLDSPLVNNFVELARYAYSTTTETQDPLREIVSQFAALNFTSMQTQEMRGLMEEGGSFPSDLMGKVNVRFIGSEELKQEIGVLKGELLAGSVQSEKDLKEMEELRKELAQGSAKSKEDLKEIEKLRKELAQGSAKSKEDLKEIEKLRKELAQGSAKSKEDLKEIEKLKKKLSK